METEIEQFSVESLPVVPNEVVAQELESKATEPVAEARLDPTPEPVACIEKALFGTDLFGESMAPKKGGELAKRFLIPPFSILNAREGGWQDRKRAWIALGIKSELGRGGESSTVDGDAERERESCQLQESGQSQRLPSADSRTAGQPEAVL